MDNLLIGDVREKLKELDDCSVQCCVTSPPYWGLRDYGESDQLGLEETPEEYVENMVKVFREVKRVLKDDGTCWLNLGDSYAGSSTVGRNDTDRGFGAYDDRMRAKKIKLKSSLKPKDLVGIPWRVALALQQDGWYLRQDIIWNKPNPMPESVQDRCTKSHEYIFLLTKSDRYYYDADAIREPLADGALLRLGEKNIENQIGSKRGHGGMKPNGNMKAVGDVNKGANKRSVWTTKYGSVENESKHRQGMHKERGESIVATRPELPEQNKFVDFIRQRTNAKKISEDSGVKLSKAEHWFRKDESGFSYPNIQDWDMIREYLDDWSDEFKNIDEMMTKIELHDDSVKNNPKGRNKRSVWTITTKPFKDAHFAVFPIEIPTYCIRAGSRAGDIVLDPFMGSGTTALASQENGRKWIGVELNPEYLKIIKKRTQQQVLF